MVMTSDRVSETVSLGPRPSFQQKVVSSHVEVAGKRRHKEQVTFRPVLAPVRYADTAYVYINNTRRRFVSKTFYEPRMRPRSFSDTTYAHPKTLEERFVSILDHHADECKRWYKTSLELKARNFKSSRVFFPNSTRCSAADEDHVSGLVDENMNNRLQQQQPFLEERYDPGASQVFIPKRSKAIKQDDLSLIEQQILVNNNNNTPGNDIDFLMLNGQTEDCSDL